MESLLYRFMTLPIVGKKVILPHVVKKEGGVKVSRTARLIAKKNHVEIGLYTYGGCFKEDFNVGGQVIVGRYCSFASDIHYYGANHPYEKAVMSPYFYNKAFGLTVDDVPRGRLVIGNDVWIGEGVIITSSCHYIGDGAVIGAGTIVTKDVPSYGIMVGNPGKVLRYRFDEETRQMLADSKWWEMNPNQLFVFYPLMGNPREFANQIIRNSKNKD